MSSAETFMNPVGSVDVDLKIKSEGFWPCDLFTFMIKASLSTSLNKDVTVNTGC